MIAPSYHTIRKKGLVHLLKGGRERNRWVGGGEEEAGVYRTV